MDQFDFTTADGWDQAYADGEPLAGPDPFVIAQAALLTPGRALDLGCGSGANAIALAEAGWSVTGIDWSPQAIRVAQRHAARAEVEVDFAVGDITNWAPPSRGFELVLSSYALPTDSQHEALKVAADSLAPGGTLLILELDPEMSAQWATGTEELITPGQIAGALDGLKIERAELVTIDRGDYDPAGHDHDTSVFVLATKPT